MTEQFLGGKVELHPGDLLEVLPTLAADSIDACVTDPPYHLTSIVKRFGQNGSAPAQFGSDGRYARASAGFMGKVWDGGDIAARVETWATVYRVLKPGAHLLAFGGTRTYGRMQVAIEDAGFEIRDTIAWLYGSGFPKSHDVSKGIDRAAGAEREVLGRRVRLGDNAAYTDSPMNGGKYGSDRPTTDAAVVTAPATDAARQWQGWGTALKPACELIVLARKPLSEATVAANVLRWGTGAINVDGCRVATDEPQETRARNNGPTMGYGGCKVEFSPQGHTAGRWPANVIHDGSQLLLDLFPDSTSSRAEVTSTPGGIYGAGNGLPSHTGIYGFDDSGSVARFFYTAKADSDDRLGSKHPTVKPLDLIQYLIRLVTPKGGQVLDPFAGTGTAGEAAVYEGMRAILIERELEYLEDIRRRMRLVMCGPDERARETAKHRFKNQPRDDGPLFEKL